MAASILPEVPLKGNVTVGDQYMASKVEIRKTTTYMNRNWRILILFDALHFNKIAASAFLPESKTITS
jgi:hypothetical protein